MFEWDYCAVLAELLSEPFVIVPVVDHCTRHRCTLGVFTPFDVETHARLVQEAMGRVGGAEPSSVLAAFVDLATLEDPGMLDRLEAAIQRRRAMEGPAQ